MIGPNSFLTAAHCVYNLDAAGGPLGWATDLVVSLAQSDDGSNHVSFRRSGQQWFGEAHWVSAAAFTGWTGGGDDSRDWDLALITLDRNVGNYTGWLGYSYNNDDDFYNGMAQTAGYPTDLTPSQNDMWYTSGNARSYGITAQQLLSNTIDIYPGQSGSPVYYDQGAQGLIAHGVVSYQNSYYNGFTRINSEVYNAIGSWIAAEATNHPAADLPDLVNWDGWFGTSKAFASNYDAEIGDALSVTSYVRNNGTANSGPFTVQYRLSETDNVFSYDDVWLGDVTMSSLSPFDRGTATLSTTIPSTARGVYHIVCRISGGTEYSYGDDQQYNDGVIGAHTISTYLTPDRFEINQTFAQATRFGIGDRTETGLTILFGDNDYYLWTARADGVLNVDIMFMHAIGDLDLALYDDNQTQLNYSHSSSDNEHVSYTVTAGKSYYIRVYGYNNAQNKYNLVIDGPEFVPDRFEPNDSFIAATNLGAGDRTETGLTIHNPNGVDFYRWTAPDDGALAVDATFTHALGDIDLELFDSNQTLLRSSASSYDNEHVIYTVAAGQSYYIRVYGYRTAMNLYDLQIDGPAFGPDRFESNDSFATATYLGGGDRNETGLTIHNPGGDDFYQWVASNNGTLTVDTLFRYAIGDLDLFLYDANQTLLSISNSSDDNEHLSYTVTAGQRYYIRVHGFNTAVNGYTLQIDGPDLAPDRFEPNDSFATATDLGTGDRTETGLTIHNAGGVDFYRWTASADGTLTVDALFTHADGDLGLLLYDDNQNILTGSLSTSDNEHMSYSVTAGQSYYIWVAGYQAAENTYDLQIDGPGTVPPIVVEQVLVSSTQWSSSFLGHLSGKGLGDGGYAIPTGGQQARVLPWTNLNQVGVRFSRDVQVMQNALSLAGVNVSQYGITNFSYDSGTFTARWTVAHPIGADRLRITVNDAGVTDTAGNLLDGEWTNGISTASGDGTPGGDFLFDFNVLPGDVNRNGGVNTQDVLITNSKGGSTAAGGGVYSPFADVNANGGINTQDVLLVNQRGGSVLNAIAPGWPAPPSNNSFQSLFAAKQIGSKLEELLA